MSGVVVDTSVWRKHFAGVASAKPLSQLLDEEEVVLTHPWIIAELVLGGISEQQEELLARLPVAAVVPYDEVLAFIHARQLTHRGVGWVDVNLLASTLAAEARLWSFDSDLAMAAKGLRVKFEPSPRSA